MSRYLHILNDTEVYSGHSLSSQIIETLPAGSLVSFNREKRREGINWMEVYMNDGSKAYVQKNKKDVFICVYAELEDDEAHGFCYRPKNGHQRSFSELFTPVITPDLSVPHNGKEYIELKRVKQITKGAEKTLTLEYDPAVVDVTPLLLTKGNNFYLVAEDEPQKAVLELNDPDLNKLVLLKGTGYTSIADKWITPVAYVIMIVTLIATFLAILSTGWIVIGTILLIPAFIMAFIAIFAVKIVIAVIAGIFGQVRKRL
jgi:hypothetical protein